MSSLNRQFKEARETMGISIKEAAAKPKVPQYRLRAVEGGAGLKIRPDFFWKYCAFLDLDKFAKQWIGANETLAVELVLISSREGT